MTKTWRRGCSLLLTLALLVQTAFVPVSATEYEEGVTVTTASELLTALTNQQSPINIDGVITIGDEADENGRMLPVEIPAGTVIQGNAGASLNCRCPIQLAGDDVVIQNLEMVFLSTDALGSVPHREIFLAGHSLTLDNVSTYLEGASGSLGGLGGTEEELLPTVYAGGFEGTTVGTNANLTIINANEDTMFEAIYMGHDAETDNKVPYTIDATINLGPKTTIRNGLFTAANTSATVNISGDGNISELTIYGIESTALNIAQTSVYGATLDMVGEITLDNGGYLQVLDGMMTDVTLVNGACLDVSEMEYPGTIEDFAGGTYDANSEIDTRGVLVLDQEGEFTIGGTVSGTTILQTDNRYVPGMYLSEWTYVSAANVATEDAGFMLPDGKLEDYELIYESRSWTVMGLFVNAYPAIGSIEMISNPTTVDIRNIISEDDMPAENAPYCEVIWKDEEGNAISADVVEYWRLYDYDTIIGVKSSYWEDETSQAQTDWGNVIRFVTSVEYPGRYYFYAEESDQIHLGDYTFLFCNEYYTGSLGAVSEVKALKDRVLYEMKVTIMESEEPNEHTHQYVAAIIQEATCKETGTVKYQCSGCDSNYTEEIPMIAHVKETIIQKAAPGSNGYELEQCKSCKKAFSKKTIYAPKKCKLAKKKYVYNGKQCKPTVQITDTKGNVISSEHYTIAYQNNVKVGKATVVVTFQNHYKGTMKKTFTIQPKATKIKKLVPKKKSITVKWKKIKKQASGYVIQISTSKKFAKKQTRKIVVTGNQITSKKIQNLKSGTKYYIRIRTYQIVTINGKQKKIYSAWSKKEVVKTP